jgi:heme exporter protein A
LLATYNASLWRLFLLFEFPQIPMLSAHRLACVRGDRRLFSALSLSVSAGEWLHVRGANGAGKTSLLRLLAGLAQPEEGDVLWCGQSIRTDDGVYRRNLLFLGHQGALKEDLTAQESLLFSAAIDGFGLSNDAAANALCKVGLRGSEVLPVRCLSAGQKRRVMLARLVSRAAKLWILDEPFTALDIKAIEMLEGLIGEHVSAGGMVVMTSHQAVAIPGGRVLQL